MMTRKNRFLTTATVVLAMLAVGMAPPRAAAQRQAAAAIMVYKSPTCGCCSKWVEHMQGAGVKVMVHDISWEQLDLKLREHGVPRALESCHLAIVDGYAVVGHVPADVILRLRRERPKITGIAVPGMPMGSPGMEQGGRKDPYEVLAFTRDGRTRVYARR